MNRKTNSGIRSLTQFTLATLAPTVLRTIHLRSLRSLLPCFARTTRARYARTIPIASVFNYRNPSAFTFYVRTVQALNLHTQMRALLIASVSLRTVCDAALFVVASVKRIQPGCKCAFPPRTSGGRTPPEPPPQFSLLSRVTLLWFLCN